MLEDLQVLAYFFESGNGKIEIFLFVFSGNLYTDARPVLGHHWVAEPHNINTFTKKFFSHGVRQARVTQYDGNYWMFTRFDNKPKLGDLFAKIEGIVADLL